MGKVSLFCKTTFKNNIKTQIYMNNSMNSFFFSYTYLSIAQQVRRPGLTWFKADLKCLHKYLPSKHLFASTTAWIIQLVNSKSEITYKLLSVIYFFTSWSRIHQPEKNKIYVLDFSEHGKKAKKTVNISKSSCKKRHSIWKKRKIQFACSQYYPNHDVDPIMRW